MGPDEDEITWVLLRENLPEPEAEIITGLLRANSIPVQEQREGINVVYRFTVGPLAMVKLYVPFHRAAEAEVLLKALAMGEPEEDGPDTDERPR